MRRLFYTLLVILALATAASANTVIFNDETSFLSALQSGYYLEDFNGFTYTGYSYDHFDFGPTNGFSYRMSSPLRGLFPLDGKMSNLESTETIIIDFTGSPSPVKAVGGNFWPTDIEGQNLAGNIDLSLSDGTQLHLTNADFRTFRGFISDGAGFTHMRISTGGGETEISYPTVDHLYIGQPAPAPNHPPVANAGPDQTVRFGSLVVLNGANSTDPDNGPQPLSFSWTQTGGPVNITLTGSTAANPTFTPLTAGNYTFSLVVNDGLANSAPSIVTITVAKQGDLNLDGKVDCTDMSIVKASFGKKCGQVGFDSRADLNHDCVVDVRDLAIVSRQLPAGTSCP